MPEDWEGHPLRKDYGVGAIPVQFKESGSAPPVDERVVATVRAYCEPLREARVDSVILGCTHYPLVRPMLQRSLGPDVAMITSGAAAARQVEHALASRGLDARREGEGDYRFLCTGDAEAFKAAGTRFLQLPLGAIETVAVDAGRAAA